MSGVCVTIYNDDKNGRDFQVVQINTLSGRAANYTIQKPGDEDDDMGFVEHYELMAGDVLIITPTGT